MAGNSWWGGLTDQITSMAKDVLQEGTEEVDDHATELQLEKKKTADLNNQITSLKAENGRLDEKVRELNESIEMNDVQLKNINSEYKSLIQDKEAELNTLKTTINELNETNQHLTNQRTDNSVFSSTHSHYNTHHFAGEDAAISALSLGDPLEGHDDDISEILNYQREVNRLHRELDTANSEIKLLRRQINQSPTVNKQPQMVDLTLQAQNSELQTKIQGLESELRSLSDKYENDLSVINQQNLNKQEELRYELEQKLEQHKIILQTAQLMELRGPPGRDGRNGTDGKSGVNYIRWGGQTCPDGASLLMAGVLAGVQYRVEAGGAEYLCLPTSPQYMSYWTPPNLGLVSRLSSVEFDAPSVSAFGTNLQDENPGCAICEVSTRSQQVMLPARYSCPTGWIREYYGYLMTAPGTSADHPDGTNPRKTAQFICVDRNTEPLTGPGHRQNGDGALLSHVVADCRSNVHSSLHHCPPYVGDKLLYCVVCTK